MKRSDGAGRVAETLPREQVYLAQTPQAFRVAVLRDALAAGGDATDEAALAERAGHPVRLVEGEPANLKITTPEDLRAAERAVAAPARRRSGSGRATTCTASWPGGPLVLGGVTIPFDLGLAGHSDADIVCHAVTDAVLGAAGLGDIGRHFPDTDPRWKGADSVALLAAACAIVREAGYTVINVDVTVIAERPKLAPHADAMRANLAGALGCARDAGEREGQDQRGRRVDGRRAVDGGPRRGAHRAGRVSGMAMRLRFAPSPTGQLHVGNARTALFNWLLARGNGGTFILRVEDTDLERSSRASEAAILEDVRWMGLDWSEGVEVGRRRRPLPPDRAVPHLSRAHRGTAVARPRVPLLLQHRTARGGSPAGARGGPAAEVRGPLPRHRRSTRRAAGSRTARRPSSASASPPIARSCSRTSCAARCGSTPASSAIPVLVRSDGVPAYNFAVVIDDALMGITHVIRGEDHISNTPRQILLYEAFGWTPPLFAHVSLVMGPDHAPLSKRHGATSVAEFRARGYLPEALTNYLALIGWSPGEGDELLPIDELAKRFRLEDVGKSAGVFDLEKLAWVNRHYLKARLAGPPGRAVGGAPQVGRLAARADAAGPGVSRAGRAADRGVGGSARTSAGAPEVSVRLFGGAGAVGAGRARGSARRARAVVAALAEELASAPPMLDRDAFRAMAARVKDRTGHKGKALFHPLRLVLTGEPEGLELDVAVPAIEHGAQLEQAGSGFVEILSARERAEQFAAAC